jgi:hypothetical protein
VTRRVVRKEIKTPRNEFARRVEEKAAEYDDTDADCS